MAERSADRRIYPRRDLRTAVVFEDEFGEGLFYVYSENISMGGVGLASSVPLRIGTLLFLSFTVPGHKRPVRATGEVVRVTRPGGGPGIGVRFIGLDEQARKWLETFLS